VSVVENLDVYLAVFGAPVTWTGAPAGVRGILDFHDTLVLSGRDGEAQVSGRVRGVTMKTVIADTLTRGQAISVTIAGTPTPFIVTNPAAAKDGAFSVVTLANPT
jgi:hypothetical protein